MTRTYEPVVAGVDGSSRSREAALWAAREARRRRTPLELVLVNDDPARTEYGQRTVAELASSCREAEPEVTVSGEAVPGHPTDVIVRRSARAGLVVVGSRGHGGFISALVGSISAGVAMHATCPVVIVRGGTPRTHGPVVVGVDHSPGGQAALRFAFDASDQRQCELIAVQVLPDAYPGIAAMRERDRADLREAAELLLAQRLAGWSETHPDVALRRVTLEGSPVTVLRDCSRDAELLVIGHHGRGGFPGMLLGSVAHAVLHHAPCSVAVVRHGPVE